VNCRNDGVENGGYVIKNVMTAWITHQVQRTSKPDSVKTDGAKKFHEACQYVTSVKVRAWLLLHDAHPAKT
jgi:hypothetical protein